MNYKSPACKGNFENPYFSVFFLLFKLIRSPSLRIIYYLIGQFELYEYQQIDYDGVMKKVLNKKKEIDENIKDMLHIEQI